MNQQLGASSGAVASALIAFVVGALTTYYDCFSTLSTRIKRVPSTFALNRLVIGLSLLCGALAAMACWLSDRDPQSVVSTVLALKVSDPWRGFVVGGSVLILIHSKWLNVNDKPWGADRLYDHGREISINDVNRKWFILRSTFQNRNINAALTDSQFETKVRALIASNIQARPRPYQVGVHASLASMARKRPPAPFSPTDPAWDTYYRAMIGFALDVAGPVIVATLPNFK